MHILMMIHRLADASPYCFFVHEQARALVARGHQVSVISAVGVPPMMNRLRPEWAEIVKRTPQAADLDGVHIEYPRHLSLGDAGERVFGGALYACAAEKRVRRIQAQTPVDLVHAHMIDRDGHAGRLLAQKLQVPFAVTAHGTDVLRYFKPDETPWARNVQTIQQADALMAVSRLLLDRVQPYRRADQITELVPNGVDLSEIPADALRKPGQILSVGSLKARKCMDRTIAAFAAIADRFPDATLRIVGVGEDESRLREQIASAHLEQRVFLLGGMDHRAVMREMAEADLFVLPSWGEGFGVVYIEAMAAGCVTMGSRGEGIDGTIRDGENGFLVAAGNVDEIAERMGYALSHPDEMAPLRDRAKRTASGMTWEANAAVTERVYLRMIEYWNAQAR